MNGLNYSYTGGQTFVCIISLGTRSVLEDPERGLVLTCQLTLLNWANILVHNLQKTDNLSHIS